MSYRKKRITDPSALTQGASYAEQGSDRSIKVSPPTRKFDICSLCVGCTALEGLDRDKLASNGGSYLSYTYSLRAKDRTGSYWSASYAEVPKYDGDIVSQDSVSIRYYGVPGDEFPAAIDPIIDVAEARVKACTGPSDTLCRVGAFGLKIVRAYVDTASVIDYAPTTYVVYANPELAT